MRRGTVAALATCLLLAGWAAAVIPPLNDGDRIAMASHIIEGRVESVDVRAEPDSMGSRKIFTLAVTVDAVLKGGGIAPGETIQVRYWHAAKRPDGWVGDTGQRGTFMPGEAYRLFLRDADDGYRLLSPNGSNRVEEPFPYGRFRDGKVSLLLPADWEGEYIHQIGLYRFMPVEVEGASPVASNVTLGEIPGGCADAMTRWEGKIRAGVETFIAPKVSPPVIDSGRRSMEIGYSWRDEPNQPVRFQNLDRLFCVDDRVWLLRYASTDAEYQTFLPVFRLIHSTFMPVPRKE